MSRMGDTCRPAKSGDPSRDHSLSGANGLDLLRVEACDKKVLTRLVWMAVDHILRWPFFCQFSRAC
jgi:hypothetical protein